MEVKVTQLNYRIIDFRNNDCTCGEKRIQLKKSLKLDVFE